MFVYIICVIVHIIYSIIYMPIFIDLAIFREVDGIHLLAILKKYWNKLASLKRSSNTQIFNSFEFKFRSAIADSYGNHILKSSQKNSYVVSHSSCMHHFTFQLAVQKGPNFSTFLMFALFFCVCLVWGGISLRFWFTFLHV